MSEWLRRLKNEDAEGYPTPGPNPFLIGGVIAAVVVVGFIAALLFMAGS